MGFTEYASYDGVGLAGLVRAGEVTSSELVDEAITRIEKHNPTLNAVVHTIYEQARLVASESPRGPEAGPLQGVPIVLKDLLGNMKGVPNTGGSRFLAGFVSPFDAELVLRYRRAGLIPVAKTNTPEFGLVPTTEPLFYGPTRNPWSTEHSTGGSSGGSAAAVAAGIVPIGHANDGGGSIRIPASCCGLVGLKPTRARNPLGPLLGDALSGLVVEHVVTRTVRDSAAVLDCTAGPDPGDPYWAPPPERPFLDEVSREPQRLRIAHWTRRLDGTAVDPECAAAADRAAELCVELGHEVEQARPEIVFGPLRDAFMQIWAAGLTASIELAASALRRVPSADLMEPLTWALHQRGQEVSASIYLAAVLHLQGASRQVARFFEQYDAWLTPTLGQPPLRLGTFDPGETDVEKAFGPLFEHVPFTWLFNATGQPAISLPLHWSREGLPVGVHFAGRFGDEGLLFRLAAQLERARPWIEHRPPIWD